MIRITKQSKAGGKNNLALISIVYQARSPIECYAFPSSIEVHCISDQMTSLLQPVRLVLISDHYRQVSLRIILS